ncbi:hypothetical protein [Mitsuokella sp. oral taxon 131]|uniref:hypothetical protein n=1 Tax=Mitsuokella sp. oral taxon 131 TaxID=1321780 RepID=UPI0003AD7E1C|nr:hypothetical protein [Mitsuokella sp. oral taxon 131]ERL25078.1 hypothetical protein HMPREF1985_00412 [Mitsuokella sp. oral taxon 131 str. W9106]
MADERLDGRELQKRRHDQELQVKARKKRRPECRLIRAFKKRLIDVFRSKRTVRAAVNSARKLRTRSSCACTHAIWM